MNLERNIPANRQMMTIPRDRSAAIYNNVPVAKPPLSFTRCLNVRYRDYGIPISTRQGYFEFELKRKKHGTLHGSRGPENFPRVKAETSRRGIPAITRPIDEITCENGDDGQKK